MVKITTLKIEGVKKGRNVNITLSQGDGYSRMYGCTISDDGSEITFPNDLNARTQEMCKSVCKLLRQPNTREGDS